MDYILTTTNVWNTCRTRRLLTGHLQVRLVVGVFHASRSHLTVIPHRHHLKIAECVRDVSIN